MSSEITIRTKARNWAGWNQVSDQCTTPTTEKIKVLELSTQGNGTLTAEWQ